MVTIIFTIIKGFMFSDYEYRVKKVLRDFSFYFLTLYQPAKSSTAKKHNQTIGYCWNHHFVIAN